jgi:hypothetical protein
MARQRPLRQACKPFRVTVGDVDVVARCGHPDGGVEHERRRNPPRPAGHPGVPAARPTAERGRPVGVSSTRSVPSGDSAHPAELRPQITSRTRRVVGALARLATWRSDRLAFLQGYVKFARNVARWWAERWSAPTGVVPGYGGEDRGLCELFLAQRAQVHTNGDGRGSSGGTRGADRPGAGRVSTQGDRRCPPSGIRLLITEFRYAVNRFRASITP